MSEESGFYQKMACNFILGNFDYEDPNNLFPKKNDKRKLMRTCRQCWASYDINASAGGCCFHRSFFRVTVPEARLGLVIGKNGSHLKEIREKSKVSNLSIPKDEGGKSLGEVHLQGKGNSAASVGHDHQEAERVRRCDQVLGLLLVDVPTSPSTTLSS